MKHLTANQVYEISGIIPNDYVQNIQETLLNSTSTSEIQACIQNIIYDGWDIQQVLHQLLDSMVALPPKKLADLKKAQAAEIIAETDAKLIGGGNEEINMTFALTSIASVIHGTAWRAG